MKMIFHMICEQQKDLTDGFHWSFFQEKSDSPVPSVLSLCLNPVSSDMSLYMGPL